MQQHREQRQHQHTDLSSSTQFTNLTVEDPEITQRIEFHRGPITTTAKLNQTHIFTVIDPSRYSHLYRLTAVVAYVYTQSL